MLTHSLSRGVSGADVAQLQSFLIAQGDLAAGNNTGYFGPLTEAAVKSFQSRNGIVSGGSPTTTGYGAVGPLTRARIASLCSSSTTQPAQTTSVTTSATEDLSIQFFAIVPSTVTAGASSIFSWSSRGSTACAILETIAGGGQTARFTGLGPSGTQSFTPARTAAYTFSCSNGSGQVVTGSPITLTVSGAVQPTKVSSSVPSGSRAPLFIFMGESNSGGYALNSDLSTAEAAPRSSLQILNNSSLAFENLDIGANNLIGHAGLSDNATQGLENGLANAIEAGRLGVTRAYLLKTGQGASTIPQWSAGNGSGYLSAFVSRERAAESALGSFTPYVLLSIGINDAIAGTDIAAWKSGVRALIVAIRAELGADTLVVMPKFEPPMTQRTAINAAIDDIVATDPRTLAISSAGIPIRDANHWSAQGFTQLAERLVDAIVGGSQLAAPTLTSSGASAQNQVVTIAGPAGATIKYTLDGTVPTSVSNTYASPLTVPPSTTLKAIAIGPGHRNSDIAVMTVATPSAAASSGSGCTAYPEVCAVYAATLGRLPDAAGAAYYQSAIKGLRTSVPGITSATLQQYIQNDINYTTSHSDEGQLITGAAGSAYGIAPCVAPLDCSALLASNAVTLQHTTYTGQGGSAAVISSSATAVTTTQAGASSAAEKRTQQLASINSALQQIVGHDISDTDKQWFVDKLNIGWTMDDVRANMQQTCAAAVGTSNACVSLSAAAQRAQQLASINSALQQIVGHDIPDADKQWFIDKLNSGWTMDDVRANMQQACAAAVGTSNACVSPIPSPVP